MTIKDVYSIEDGVELDYYGVSLEVTKRKKTPIYALSLDGISGYIMVNATTSINNLTTITIVAAIIAYSNGENGYGRIFCKSNANGKLFYLGESHNNSLSFIHRGTVNGGWETPINSIPYNTIKNVAMTYDNTIFDTNVPIIYIDGIVQSLNEWSNPSGSPSLETDDLYIGNAGAADNRTFNGLIYNIAYFNIILTPTQVANLSNGSIRPTDISGCMLYHDYTKGTARDYSGNGNDGTLQGNARFIETG